MKNIFFLGVFLSIGLNSINAQIIFNNDTTVCGMQSFTLQAISSGVDSLVTDDVYTDVVDLGFNFDFYGNTYNKMLISSNGYVTFDTTNSSGFSPWDINAAIPNPGIEPEDAILITWQDTDPNVAGAIYFGSYGAAPNRVYVVTWCGLAMFQCNSDIYTSQLRIFEGSNRIEMYIKDKPLCIAWNLGAAIQGTVDATSTNFDIVNDPLLLLPRNFPLTWTATNEGWEFIPNGITSFNINQIPFVPVAAGATTWTDVLGNIIGLGTSINVMPSVTTTYFATMQSQCSGTVIDSVTITVGSNITSNVIPIDASCEGDDASIKVIPNQNLTQPPWTINILDLSGTVIQTQNNVMNSYIFTNLFPGSYMAQVIEPISGCSGVTNVSVGQDSMALSLLTFQQNVSCYNSNDGYISALAQNGVLPYSYFINNLLNTNAFPYDSSFSNLTDGVYVISVVDSNSCMQRDTVKISSPHYPLQVISQSKVVICHGSSNGLAVGFGSGGTPGYSYEWFDASYTSFSLNDTAYGLSSGSYYLEVMDANGCDTFTSVQVIAPQTSLSGNPQIFGVVCKGDSTGMLVGDAQGSWSPYQYYWLSSTGDTLQDSGVRLTRDTLSGLVSGSYDLHVYDAKGCSVSYSLLVGEPATKLSIDSMAVILSIACYGDTDGSAKLYASGGMPNYAYLWDNGEIDIVADELTSGYHGVLLSDDWGCEIEDSIYIPENPEIESQISTIQNASCYGYNDGIAWIESVGGVPAYTYFWSNGQAPGFMPDTASGLLYGSYYVTTRDILGCEVVDSIYISEPEPLSMEASELDWIDCSGDSTGLAYATAVGGTAPYTFVWDNGQWTGDTINSLTSGLHTVVVTDAKGCSATDTVLTHEPPKLTIVIDSTQTVLAYCIGVNTASLTAIASGGTPGYTYQWNDNAVNPQTTTTASSLLAGVYTITVTDTKGCIASDARDIDTLTNTMDATVTSLIQYVGGNDVSCFGEDDGKAMVTALGAHAPYVYQWYGPNGFNSNNDSITNLYAGTYSVTVRDTNNCMVNSSIVIEGPDYIYFTTLGFSDESCLGACNGDVQVDITGGVTPYTGIATENTTGNTITSLMANDSVVSGICSGAYTLTITDVNNCLSSVINGGVNQQTIGTSIFTTSTIDPAAITNVLCNGAATGFLQVLNPNTATGYSYSWQNAINPGISISTTTQATSLIAGTYVLYAHYADGNNLGQNYSGCTTTDTVSITELSILQSVVTITDVDCYGATTGKLVSGQVSGGTSLYDLEWNPGGVLGDVMNNLTAGTYTLTITDANSCQEVDTFEVTELQALTANITQNGYVLTAGSPIGGTLPFSYSWRKQSNPNTSIATGTTYTVSNYGIYYVLVTDGNGCITESNSFEYEAPPLSIDESASISLSIYPNPFKDETTVDFGRAVKQASVRVVDVFGKLIEEHSITNSDKHILKRENKASGIYFMEIEVEGVKLFNKLIIE